MSHSCVVPSAWSGTGAALRESKSIVFVSSRERVIVDSALPPLRVTLEIIDEVLPVLRVHVTGGSGSRLWPLLGDQPCVYCRSYDKWRTFDEGAWTGRHYL